MINKNSFWPGVGIGFWSGMGVMSLINAMSIIINPWKITQDQHALLYACIMFGFSVIFIITGLLLIKTKK